MNLAIIENMQACTVKILCTNAQGATVVGTGIRISDTEFLTCAHVTLGVTRLRTIVEEAKKLQCDITDENIWMSSRRAVRSLTVRDAAGIDHPATVTAFNPEHDIATLKANVPGPIANIDPSAGIHPGQELLLFGFPYAIDTAEADWSFAVYPGMASRTVEAFVGGSRRRKYIEVAGVSFGGNSGGPVVDRKTGTVVGMINGHMVWGRDDVLVRSTSNQEEVGSTDTPLGITYATEWGFMGEIGLK